MRMVRGMGGALLWIVACVIGLLGAVLSITLILLPLGLPLLLMSRKLFGVAMKLFMPRSISHPVEEAGKSLRKKRRKAKDTMPDSSPGDAFKQGRKRLKKQARRTRKRLRR